MKFERLGQRLALAAFFLFVVLLTIDGKPSTAEEWVAILLRSLVFSGIALGAAWTILPVIAFVYAHVFRAAFRTMIGWLQSARRRVEQRKAEWEQRQRNAEWERDRPRREREAHEVALQAEVDAQIKGTAQKWREDVRAECDALYALAAPEIGTRFSKHEFAEFVSKYMTDATAPEDKPKNRIWANPDRSDMEIRFPIVNGFIPKLTKGLLRCDFDQIEPLNIDPKVEPTATYLRPAAGYVDAHSHEKIPFEYIQQDRERYYAQTHFQSILFQITQRLVDDFQSPTAANTDKKSRVMRLQSRHELFPQIYSFVDRFARTKVNLNGANPKELGLQKYLTQAVEKLRRAIYPDEYSGEPPLVPILDNYRPVGSTGTVDFTTTRPVVPSSKSHINAVVIDSGFEKDEWEKKAVDLMESEAASSLVLNYARNDHLGLVIRYEYLDVEYSYSPDFIVRLTNDLLLLLEIKGFERDKAKNDSKNEAARRWVSAVNNLGDFGRWEFRPCYDLDLLLPLFGELVGQQVPVTSVKSKGDLF